MTRVGCIADLHGHLPDPATISPGLEPLCIAGDITPHPARDYPAQLGWLDGPFRTWLSAIPCPVVGIAGNHDWVFAERAPQVAALRLPWTYLEDSGAAVAGLRVYGTPWQPRFFDWAFNLDEPELAAKWALIPGETDVLIVHGPPHGIGDRAVFGLRHCGSPSLRSRIEAIAPRLVVCGHIHEGRGVYELGGTTVVNAAMADERYRPAGGVIVVELSDGPGS